ncbi:MAG TPA: aminopeptidase P N-terminal domain-containing protein [Bacteroidia bacterium]|jgi:Xaa-Pro aminopeptidase|nr:aminopeptidase P N-terminal domain-containing protein [Bacteroidia bacterium]
MRYAPINNTLFIENRHRLAKQMQPSSIAIFNSNDVMPTSADGTMKFRQHADIFYLSGIDQEESILVMFPDCPDPDHREVLFVRETNDHIAVWEGEKLSKEQATKLSGIKKVYWTHQFKQVLTGIIFEAKNIYLNTNEHVRAVVEVETRDARFAKWCRETYPMHHYIRVAPILHDLRAIKSFIEVELIQKACDLTEKGFRRVLGFVKPGVWEYEIEAELGHEFVRAGASYAGYEPIIAAGKNSCVLHYNINNKQCKDGDILLMDFAAGYANYQSDLTRTIPVNGKFTKRQKNVYNAVLRVMRFAMTKLVVGNTIQEYHKEVGLAMEEELLKLRLINKTDIKKQDPAWPAYKKYFMHGTSHYLGLDVHDVGSRYRKFAAGMVFTCEPGIYIPEEGIGVRIENDILITKKGNQDLMKNIPIEADEIEALMKK